MADTHFMDYNTATPIVASWLNDVNDLTYGIVKPTGASLVGLGDNTVADLVTENGPSLIPYKATGTQTRVRNLQTKLGDQAPHFADYLGYDPTGTNSNADVLERALVDSAGRPIITGTGSFVIDREVKYTTSGNSQGLQLLGDGAYKTIFINEVSNGAMLTLDGTSLASEYGMDASLKGFSVTTRDAPPASRGIDIKGQWFLKIKQAIISNLSSDAIRIINMNSDADASDYLVFEQMWLHGCGGWGLNCTNPTLGNSAIALATLRYCQISFCEQGGARLLGLNWNIERGSISYNGGAGGLVLPYVPMAGSQQNLTVVQTEFDGNNAFQIDLQSCLQAELIQPKLIYRGDGVGIRIGNGGAGAVSGVSIKRPHHRRTSGTVTAHSIGSNASNVEIIDAYYPTTAGVTKVINNGTNTRIRDEGKDILAPIATMTTTTSGSFTPNMAESKYHRVIINAVDGLSIQAPSNAQDGLELLLDVYNASGSSSIPISFSPAYAHSGFTTPAAGKRRTARFIYFALSSVWVQMGAWSPDI